MMERKITKSHKEEVDETLAEMERTADRMIRILESNGITKQALFDNLDKARRKTFEKYYPALAAEISKKRSSKKSK